MNAGRGQLRVRKVNAGGLAQRLAQAVCCVDLGPRRAGFDGDAGFHDAQFAIRACTHLAGLHQAVDQGLRQDQHVAGRAVQQALFHGADRAKGGVQFQAAVRFECGLQLPHQALGRAAAE